ncbi:prefoldin subunit [archaeon]|nr:prefoldin subunit [archaeon]
MVDLTQEEMNEARMLNQQFQMLLAQKQSLSMRSSELEIALKEVETAQGRVFYGAGSVLIESDKNTVKERLEKQDKELKETIETLTAREESVRKKIKEFQTKVEKSPEKE